MNKYMGFYELKSINIPTVPWECFTQKTELDKNFLWTLRVAVEQNDDLNLPRLVGANYEEALLKGKELLDKFSGRGIVIYYPYFIAEKSGVLDINNDRTVIEAVDKDLWNLVSYGKKDVTVVISELTEISKHEYYGNTNFLNKAELDELLKYASIIKGRFREEIIEGKSILAEWSYAYNTDINHKPIGEKHLIFYELRSI